MLSKLLSKSAFIEETLLHVDVDVGVDEIEPSCG
jgi:hypothetical protein